MNNKYVVIDLETTGHSPANSDKIIEVGIAVINNDVITEEFSTFLNPNQSVPDFISYLTGIRDEDVIDAPEFQDKAMEIKRLFENGYFVAHNVPFDLGFFNEELESNGFSPLKNPVLDTVELARVFYPQAPGFRLGQLADYLNINHGEPHRALTDARMTADLLLMLLQKIKSLPFETITHLLRLEKGLHSDLYALLNEQETKLAYTNNIRSDIDVHRGIAIKKLSEINAEKANVDLSFGSYLDGIYEKGGTMERLMDHYEKRTGQRNMSETVYDAFQMKKHAMIEAETGTGKSLAYLLPAIYESVNTGKKIVISTYTTHLQSQLLDEEIPFIRELIPFSFQVALLKGKRHYISLEKFERVLINAESDNYDITLTKAMILVWLTETETGDIDEIQLPSKGYIFYKQISTEAEGAIDPSSPWFSRSYYQKARRQAQQADIVITNHALLCTDIFKDYQLLPTYNRAIIDEAHHLEETASKHYGLQLHYVQVQNILSEIGETNNGQWLDQLLQSHLAQGVSFSEKDWNTKWARAKNEVDDLFRTLFQYVVKQNQTHQFYSDIGRMQYRFQINYEYKESWSIIQEMVNRLISYLSDLIEQLTRIYEQIIKNYNESASEIWQHIESLQLIIDRSELLFLKADEQMVKWMEIEANGAKNAVYVYSEPTDISAMMSDDFFDQKESIILTSATLSIKNSFKYSQRQLGLTDKEMITEKIPSPFPYEQQVQLLVPNDFPDVRYSGQDEFIQATCEAIISLANITDGRMLVLFTSYDMLKRAYSLLNETIDMNKYKLIAQGISSGSRSRLKKNFQSFDQSILLGTSSFWEGVDIPGQDLSCLMIVRLPFQPPHHPVYEAKSKALKQEGKNAFFDLALPHAVIRFKQGFGRLIRSASDRGIVFVCDARIMKARYGKFFTESIPDVPQIFGTTNEIIRKAAQWF